MREFPASPITALIDQTPRYNLGESMGADLTVAELLGPDELGPDGLAGVRGVRLGYGTSTGDPELRALVAARHGIPDGQVLITAGAAAALFLVSLLCGDGEVVLGQPGYPPTLSALRGIGAPVVTVLARFEDGYRVDLDAFARAVAAHPAGHLRLAAEPLRRAAHRGRGRADARGHVPHLPRGPAADRRDLPGGHLRRRAPGRQLRRALASLAHLRLDVQGLRGARPAHWLADRPRARALRTAPAGPVQHVAVLRLPGRVPRRPAAQPGRPGAGRTRRGAGRGARHRRALDQGAQWGQGPGSGCRGHSGLGWLPPGAGSAACASNRVPSGPRRSTASTRTWPSSECWSRPGPWFGDSANVVRLGLAYEPADRLEAGLEVIGAALEATAR